MMKLSDESLNVLKNFAGINQNILFEEGRRMRTVSPQRTIYAEAEIKDTIEGEAGIYDLTSFLASMSVMKDAEIMFTDKMFKMEAGTLKLKFRYASPDMLVIPPKTSIKLPNEICSFNLPWDRLEVVMKLAAVHQLADIAINVNDGVLTLEACDTTNPSANQLSDTIEGDYSDVDDFRVIIKTENLKLMPRDYKVTITNIVVAFDAIDDDGVMLKYWISAQHKL